MKKLMIFILLLASIQGFSQKKKNKNKEPEVDPKDLLIDSLTKASNASTMQLDSITKQMNSYKMQSDSLKKDSKMYYGVYTTLKEKVFKYDFAPSRTSALIDSLRTSRDEASLGLTSASNSLKDSLTALKADYNKLKTSTDAVTNADAKRNKAVDELKQLKDLLDNKIINQKEYDSKKAKVLEKW